MVSDFADEWVSMRNRNASLATYKRVLLQFRFSAAFAGIQGFPVRAIMREAVNKTAVCNKCYEFKRVCCSDAFFYYTTCADCDAHGPKGRK